ncbi:hypothetical protein ACIBH1_33720 [Nonomuraea sp. NPDC050663]|uniref:hypothetical protein n=1 Tax=Nonomuraea sp. NPDC050663 TaxID=3364370 RepID=UPI00379281FE
MIKTIAAISGMLVIAGLPAPSYAGTVEEVRSGDLGPAGPWIRLQDDPNNAGRQPGVQEVTSFTDPVRFNGSLHLRIDGGEQAQAARYFVSGGQIQAIPLARIAASPVSYDTYVSSAGTTAAGVGPSLQLPMFCGGLFTTLSFQPQLAGGVRPDEWQHFTSTGSSLWRTSRAIAGVAAGADATFDTFVNGCTGAGDGAIGVIANIGRLGDTTATLDTYVDNITLLGTTYDFTTGRRASIKLKLPRRTELGGPAARSTLRLTNPAGGPHYRAASVRLSVTGYGITPGNLRLSWNGRQLSLTRAANGALSGSMPLRLAAATPRVMMSSRPVELAPGAAMTASLRLKVSNGVWGKLVLKAELLAEGFRPDQPTGVTASAWTRVFVASSGGPSANGTNGKKKRHACRASAHITRTCSGD